METIKIKKISQFRALMALTKASLISAFRNPTSIFFNFFFPFIFIVIFGIIGQGSASFDVAIRPESITSGPFYEAIKKVEVLNLKQDLSNEDIDESLKKGELAVAIKIEEVKDVQGISTYNVVLEKSAAEPRNAQTISSIVNSLITAINFPEDSPAFRLIKMNETTVEGRKYQQIDFILPGQLGFALLSNALFGISFTFLSMRKQLIIKRITATPVSKFSIIWAEALSKTLIAVMQTTLIILVGHYVFNFTLANGFTTFVEMLMLSLVGLTVFMGFGLLVPQVSNDENSMSPIANLIMMPQLFLSGAFFPITLFPEFLQPIAKLLPMTYLNEAFRKVAFEGISITETLPEIAAMLIWAVVLYLLVVKLFKWE